MPVPTRVASRPSPTTLLVAALVAGLLAGLAGALTSTTAATASNGSSPRQAAAHRLTVQDRVGDVFVIKFTDHEEFRTNPRERRTDLTRVTFDYRPRVLVVTSHLRRVVPRDDQTLLTIRGGGKSFEFLGRRGGKVDVGAPGRRTTCAGASHTYQPGRGTITTRIPARCFDSPGRARFNLNVRRHTEGPGGTGDLSDELSPKPEDGRPHFTSPVARG